MGQRRILQGISVTVLGLALALAPMASASASKKHHKPTKHHHSTKTVSKSGSKTGSNPGAQLCVDIATTDKNSVSEGAALGKAMESAATGGFAGAKQAIIAAINEVLKEEGPAESVLSSAPANVQAAIKGLFTFESSFKTAVANASSLTQLEQSLVTLGNSAALKADGVTLDNYVSSVCGTTTPST